MTDIRPELSAKNPYGIDKHRYYELKHFCLQYNDWKKIHKAIDSSPQAKISGDKNPKIISDPVFHTVERREEYLQKIELVETAAKLADEQLAGYLVHAVTEGISYYGLRLYYGMPACKEKYYGAYRRFFFILDKTRK